MKPSKRTLEIEARRAADPIAQELGRTDIDYSSDDLPTAPREMLHHGVERRIPIEPQTDTPISRGRIIGWANPDFKCSCGALIVGAIALDYKFCPYCGKPKETD